MSHENKTENNEPVESDWPDPGYPGTQAGAGAGDGAVAGQGHAPVAKRQRQRPRTVAQWNVVENYENYLPRHFYARNFASKCP